MKPTQYTAALIRSHEIDTSDLSPKRPKAVADTNDERRRKDWPEPRCHRAYHRPYQYESGTTDEQSSGPETIDKDPCAWDTKETA
jgi:hypothetical protein